MFEPETRRFLEGGCALIVGVVGAAGEPMATRGWGLDVVDAAGDDIRILLDADDTPILSALGAGGAIAITAADVLTFESRQIKGRAKDLAAATPAQRRRVRRYCDEFFADIVATDGTDPDVLERFVPADFVMCTVGVDAHFDQTPGPSAGAPIEQAGA